MNIFFRLLCTSLCIAGLSPNISAQEASHKEDREKELQEDIERLGRRAVRDRIITNEERKELKAFEQKLLDEAGYIGNEMVPDRLYEPEDYESPQERRRRNETAAVAYAAIDAEELLKYVKPLPMKPWLMATLRLLFGNGVSQRPERWDQVRVPQMGGLYYIIMPGGQPDDSWRDAPPMAYDPHPDKHFRR